jgi:hypothetical protein
MVSAVAVKYFNFLPAVMEWSFLPPEISSEVTHFFTIEPVIFAPQN